MKKFFIYFIATTILFTANQALSGVQSISEPVATKPVDLKKHEKELNKLYKEIPDLNNKKAIESYRLTKQQKEYLRSLKIKN